MKTLIIVKGGAVQKVYTDVENEVVIVDYDTEGVNVEELVTVNGEEVSVSEISEVNPKELYAILKQIKGNKEDIAPLTVQGSAISSMNYFFLRLMTGKSIYPGDVMSEMESYLNFITPDSFADPKIRSILISEMQEGDYFTGMQLTSEVVPMLKAAILTVTGDIDRVVFDAYFSLIKESLAEEITLLEQKQTRSMSNILHELECSITHVERIFEGGNEFFAMETTGVLYPRWDCNEWAIELHYQGKTKKFLVYRTASLGAPDKTDILNLIFSRDYGKITKSQFIKNNGYDEYSGFFKEYGEQYGEIEKHLGGLWSSAMHIRGFLIKLLGIEDYLSLKAYMGYE